MNSLQSSFQTSCHVILPKKKSTTFIVVYPNSTHIYIYSIIDVAISIAMRRTGTKHAQQIEDMASQIIEPRAVMMRMPCRPTSI